MVGPEPTPKGFDGFNLADFRAELEARIAKFFAKEKPADLNAYDYLCLIMFKLHERLHLPEKGSGADAGEWRRWWAEVALRTDVKEALDTYCGLIEQELDCKTGYPLCPNVRAQSDKPVMPPEAIKTLFYLKRRIDGRSLLTEN